MAARKKESQIVAMGGGGLSRDPDRLLLDRYVFALAGRDRPKVCFLPQASAENEAYIIRFYEACAALGADGVHLSLFKRDARDLRGFILANDIVWVGGGNTASMLAVWRVHGVDRILYEARDMGKIFTGSSAGGNCWFEASSTDSFGPLDVLADGMGFLPGAFCPHYHGEPERRPTLERFVREGRLPTTFAADDGCALHFSGRDFVRAVSSRPEAKAYRVELCDGAVIETVIETRYLDRSDASRRIKNGQRRPRSGRRGRREI